MCFHLVFKQHFVAGIVSGGVFANGHKAPACGTALVPALRLETAFYFSPWSCFAASRDKCEAVW